MKRYFLWAIAVGLLIALVWVGCGTDQGPVAPSDETALEPAAKLTTGLARAIEVQDRNTDRLIAISGVVGTATGLGSEGNPAVLVFTKAPGIAGIPNSLDGVPVIVKITGEIRALKGPPSGKGPGGGKGDKVDPTARFNRPVPIGISTGNIGECSSGTIGARVTDGINVFALSNNHVYALGNNAPIGSAILQPGLFDTDCVFDENNVIGTLSDFESIVFSTSANNTIDAAIALSTTGDLGNATPSDGYGLPKSAIVSAMIGQAVQKYGRTTSLRKGVITGLNATVNVGYNSGTARFVNQIIVQARKPFIKAGDSGSLLVIDPERNPVGLLFAGTQDGKLAVANRIDLVLGQFNVTIDGE